ncbi:hypothetical protein [Sphingobium sp. C100]|uniref:hypothetical protein n=1 Tax=Sphingobium sp. C100 TaxID=1207055 RepID=UPI000417CB6D|nr:hypothetical protein [Sphingobium sp. C100]
MTLATTAEEAFARYEAAFNEDRLIQDNWHEERDGRNLACALGVLGEEVDGPAACPADVMPRWLAKMVPWFFDRMEFDDARQWGLEFYAELKRLGGKVPFDVIYRWHADHVTTLAIEVSEERKRDPEPHRKLQSLHRRALAGDRAPVEEWRAILRDAGADAYADADADATRRARMTRLARGMVECLKAVLVLDAG